MHHIHQLELTVADTPLVLDRIVSILRGRRCAIHALRFEAADRHRPGRVYAEVEADAQHARLATHHLASMPGVLAVAVLGVGSERAEVHAGGVTDVVMGVAARA